MKRRILISVFVGLISIASLAFARAVTDVLIKAPRASTSFSKSLAHYTMGIIYDSQGATEKAITQYEKAIKLEPSVSYIHTRLAVDYLLVEKQVRALAELKIAQSLDQSDPKPHFLMGLIYTSSNDFELAKAEYEKIVRIDPDSILALSSLADILVLQKKMEDASSIYERLIEKEQDAAILHFNLGVIYSRLDKLDKAMASLKRAIELEPDYFEAYVGLGALRELNKDIPGAIENFEKALSIDPLNVKLYRHLGLLYLAEKKTSDAIRQYELALKLDPKDAGGYIALGYAYSVAGDSGKALKYFATAVELAPEDPRPRFYSAIVYDAAKDMQAAERELREAIKLDPEFAEAYNYMGYMFAETGQNLDEATALVNKALSIEPDNGAYIDSLGWIYYKKGMMIEALGLLERASALEPDEPEIKQHLEEVRMQLKAR